MGGANVERDGNDFPFPELMLFPAAGGARILARGHPGRTRKSLEIGGDINRILPQVVESCVYRKI